MGLVDLMKELRLMKDQQGYRYCMAWFVVLTHLLARPTLVLLILWLIQRFDHDTMVGKAIAALVPVAARVLSRYMQST
jgi:hypothetical protein